MSHAHHLSTAAGASLLRWVLVRRYYVIVAWIWSLMFYLGLDPLKWLMAWVMNEDGFRDRTLHEKSSRKVRRSHASPPNALWASARSTGQGALGTLARSVQQPPSRTMLKLIV